LDAFDGISMSEANIAELKRIAVQQARIAQITKGGAKVDLSNK